MFYLVYQDHPGGPKFLASQHRTIGGAEKSKIKHLADSFFARYIYSIDTVKPTGSLAIDFQAPAVEPARRKAGRPSKADRFLSSGLHPFQDAALRALGETRGVSAAAVLREAVDFYLAYQDTLRSTQADLEDLVMLGQRVFYEADCGDAASLSSHPLTGGAVC